MELFCRLLAALWEWISRICCRTPQLSSRSRHRAMIGVRQLEERIVLDASFALTGGALVLNDFDGGSTGVTVSEGQFDVDTTVAGNEDVYSFQLDGGVWTGNAIPGVTSISGNTLHVLKSAVNDHLQITDSLDNNLQVALQALGVGTSGAVNADVSVQAQAINLDGSLTTDGRSVLLDGTTTIGQNVAITTTNADASQNAGAVTFDGEVNGTTTQTLTVNAGSSGTGAAGNVTFGGAVGSSANLQGLSVIGKDVLFDGTVGVTTGGVTVESAGTFTLNGNLNAVNGAVQITSGSTLSLNADVNSGNQVIQLAAADDITLQQLTTTNATASAVSITSSDGAIRDGNGDIINIMATSGVTRLRAAQGIGSGDALEVSLSEIDAENSISGDIQLLEADAITVLNLRQTIAGNISLIASGTVAVTNGSAPVVSTAGTGEITLTAEGANSNLTLQGGVSSEAGNIELSAGRNLTQSISGNVVSQSGDLTARAGGTFTMANGLFINTGTGKIDIQSNDDATLGLLQSQKSHAEAIKVVSLNARILSATGSGLNIDAQADGAITTLSAATGIGTTKWLETNVDQLDVHNSTSGDIRIAEADHLTVVNLIQSATGNIELTAQGAINAASADARIEAQGGTISLLAGADITLGQVKTDNTSVTALTITSQTGAILGLSSVSPNLTTPGSVILNAATGIGAPGAELRTEIARLSATNSTSGDIQISEADALTVVSMKQTGLTATGEIVLRAAGPVTIANTTPNAIQAQGAGGIHLETTVPGAGILVRGKINAVDGNVTLNAIQDVEFTATGQVATAGNVQLTTGNEIKGTAVGTHLIADELTLNAAAGITLLNTSVNSLSATNSTSGNIQIKEADDVTVTSLTQSTGTGDISLTTVNGTITVDSGTPGTIAVQTHGAGEILLEAGQTGSTPQDLYLLSSIATDAGKITLRADQNLTVGTGTSMTSQTGEISVTATHGELEMQGTSRLDAGTGAVTLLASGDVVLGHVTTTNNTASAVHITSQSGAILDGGNSALPNVQATSTNAVTTLGAAAGIGTLNDPLRTNLDRLVATNSGLAGDISIEEANHLIVQSLKQTNTAGNGSLSLKTLNGTLTVDNGSPSVIAVQTYGTGSLALEAGGVNSDLSVQSEISSASGGVSLVAGRDALFGDSGDLASTSGSMSVTAVREIQMSPGTQFNAGSGTIAVTADGDVTLGELRTTSAAADAVTVTSLHGKILDGNGTASNIVAASPDAVTTLRASAGIGTDDALEVDLGKLDAVNSSTGDIRLTEANAITVLNLQQSAPAENGSIELVTLAGTITVDSPTSGVAVQTHGTGTVTLQAGGATSDLSVLDQIATEQGSLHLQAGQNLTFDQTGGITTSQNVSLQAGGAIDTTGSQLITASGLTTLAGAGIVLQTAVDTISALNGTSGNIRITEADDITVIALKQSSGSGDVSLVTRNGTITVDAGNAVAVEAKTSGTVLLQAQGADAELLINSSVNTAGGTVTLLAAGQIQFGDNGDITTTGTTGHVSAESATGDVTMSSGSEIRSAGRIEITANQGDVTLGLLHSTLANSNVVTVTASGAILDGNGTDLNIDANAANALTTLTAVSGIGAGSPSDPLDTTLEIKVTRLSATNGSSGDIRLQESDGISVANLTQLTSPGVIELVAHGLLTVENTLPGSPTIQTGGGPLTLQAQGALSDLDLQGGVSSSGGAIALAADHNIIFGSDGDLSSHGGEIHIATGSDIQMADGSSIDAGDGTIELQAQGTITLGELISTRSDPLVAVNAVVVTSTTGAIQDGNGTSMNIRANGENAVTQLRAATGIASTAGNPLETQVAILDAINSSSGSIQIEEADEIVVKNLRQLAGAGNVTLRTVDGTIALANTNPVVVQTFSVGAITLDAHGDGSDLFVQSAVQSELGDITLQAENNVILQQDGDVTSQSGNIFITGQSGAVNILNGRTVQTAGNITIDGETGILLNGLLKTTGNGSIAATASNGDITLDNGVNSAIQTSDVGTILVDAQGDGSDLFVQSAVQSELGDITLQAENNVSFGDDGDVTSQSGAVFVTAQQGALSMSPDTEITSGTGRIHLDARQDVTLGTLTTGNANSIVTDAAVMVTSHAGAVKDGNDSALNISASHVSSGIVLQAASGIGAGDALEIDAVRLTAEVTATGAIEIAEVDSILLSDVQTENGAITLTAGGAITAQNVVSRTDADGNDISLTSTSGDISVQNINAGTAAGDVLLQSAGSITSVGSGPQVTADDLQASAVSGIHLDTTINTLSAQVSDVGSIQIQETDAVDLEHVVTKDGAITVTAAGLLTAVNVVSQTDADTNDISLTSTSGGILVQKIDAGTSAGDVILQAQGGAIDRIGSATQINITADDLDAAAVSGVDLYTRINDLVGFVSGTGDFLIEEADDINLASSDSGADDARIQTANGRIQIRAAGSMTIVDTDPSNDGPDRRQDEEIIAGGSASTSDTSAGRILLQAGNIGSLTGDLIFQPSAQISAVEAGNDRGAIVLIANGNFEFDSDTSQITTYKDLGNGDSQGGTLRSPIPTIDNLTGGNPDLVASGSDYRGTFEVQLGAATQGEEGLEIHIDWGDQGTKRYEGPDYQNQTALNGSLEGLSGESHLTLAHDYTIEDVQFARGNGRQNSTDPMQVRFAVSHDPSIVIFANTFQAGSPGKIDGDLSLLTTSNNLQGSLDEVPLDPVTLLNDVLSPVQSGQSVDSSQFTGTINTLITPQANETLESGVQTFRVPPVIPPRDLFLIRDPAFPVSAPPAPAVPPSPIVTAAIQVVPTIPVASSTTSFRDEYFQIKAISPDPNADTPLAPPERLPDDILSGDQLNLLFQQLPDGQYQIDYVLGEGNERSILKFDIRQGQPVVPGGEALDGGQLKLEDITEQLKRASESASPDSDTTDLTPPDSQKISQQVSDQNSPELSSRGPTVSPAVSHEALPESATPTETTGSEKELQDRKQDLGTTGPVVLGTTALLRRIRRRQQAAARFSATGRLMQRFQRAAAEPPVERGQVR